MMVLGSAGDSLQFEKPSELIVHRVLRGRDAVLRQYAVGESIDESGARRPVAVTMRSRWRWLVPGDGREVEALIWNLDDLETTLRGDRYDVPARGASIGWVKQAETGDELVRWRRRNGQVEHG